MVARHLAHGAETGAPQFVEVITALYACGVTVRETGHCLLAPPGSEDLC